jgi:hypothetical protein
MLQGHALVALNNFGSPMGEASKYLTTHKPSRAGAASEPAQERFELKLSCAEPSHGYNAWRYQERCG